APAGNSLDQPRLPESEPCDEPRDFDKYEADQGCRLVIADPRRGYAFGVHNRGLRGISADVRRNRKHSEQKQNHKARLFEFFALSDDRENQKTERDCNRYRWQVIQQKMNVSWS